MKNNLPKSFAHYTFFNANTSTLKPSVGISSCLLGEKVRFDGQDKFFPLISVAILPYITPISLCPEVAIGMGVPRPSIQLVEHRGHIEARGIFNATINMTVALKEYANAALTQHSNLCGYIFKARSPSCGNKTTPLYDRYKTEIKKTDGIYANKIKAALPWLPVCDEEDLKDEAEQIAFLFYVHWLQDWQLSVAMNIDQLGDFHRHHQGLYQLLPSGIQAALSQLAVQQADADYLRLALAALRKVPAAGMLKHFDAIH